ncbi:MAG: RNA polymerase sigma factor [Gaiellaceae bacterium]
MADPLARPEELLRRVYAYVAYRVRDRSEAEEITGETFVRAVRYRDRYDPRLGEPIAWLLGIARRCIYDASLQARTESADAEPAVGGDLEGEVVSRIALASAIAALSSSDRDLIALKYGADLSTREIARVLEMRPGSVDVALSRARSRLRELIESDLITQRPSAAKVADERL